MDNVTNIAIENVGNGIDTKCLFEVSYSNGSFRCFELNYHVKSVDDINQVLFDIGDDMVPYDFQNIVYH